MMLNYDLTLKKKYFILLMILKCICIIFVPLILVKITTNQNEFFSDKKPK